MSVEYVAVYEKGGNSTPRGQAIQAGEVKAVHGDCLDNHGFPYDDDASQSSDISVARPQYMIVAIGW